MKIIFDLDDTVYNNSELRGNREKAILNVLGNRAGEYNKLRKIYSTTKSLEILGITREEFYEILKSVQINLKKDEKLIDFFKELSNRFRLIVLSNSPKKCAADVLECLGLTEIINEIYGGDSFSEPKPSEESFFMVEKGDICIGNNFKKDLEIPGKKGAITIFISKEKNILFRANFVIESIYELKDILDNISKE